MTEELNNFCTDLKDLFMKQDFDTMEKELAAKSSADVYEMACREQGVIAQYYQDGKYELILTHLNFVAFASYLYEYAGKRGIIIGREYAEGMDVFQKIFELCQTLKNQK